MLAAYGTKDNIMFLQRAFNKSTIHLSRKYWHSIDQIAKLEPVKRFYNVRRAILCCPLSSAGKERLHSSAALLYTKLRSRLTNERVAKSVLVCRHFEWKEKYNTLCVYFQNVK